LSRQHINAYRRTLAEQHRVTGSLNERVLRKAFAELLERTGRARCRWGTAAARPAMHRLFGFWFAHKLHSR